MLYSVLIGIVVYSILDMDEHFAGFTVVSPEPFVQIYDDIDLAFDATHQQ